MDELKTKLKDFIATLNAECDFLKKTNQIQTTIDEPWRFYSLGIDTENEYQLLRAVIEAGRYTVEVENLLRKGKENDAWKQLSLAQMSLIKALSTRGKADGATTREKIFEAADDILGSDSAIAAHPKWRGLASKVANKLSEDNVVLSDNHVRKIIKDLKPLLVNR